MRGERDAEGARIRRTVAPLRCAECKTISSSYASGWRGYRTDDPEEGEPPALAFYCPDCAEREFGGP
jgi:hypothetical protein